MGDSDGDGIPEWKDVTKETGVGGKWHSREATVGDIDRDGDLDIYVANSLDRDFWGPGMDRFAGNRNQLYLNQLAETGEFKFRDAALEMKVSGLHKEEKLPNKTYFPLLKRGVATSKQIVNGKQVGEEADPTLGAGLVDWNDDGWLDLIVSNNLARLRVYKNMKGKTFQRLTDYDGFEWIGSFMGVKSGDLDGDGYSEIFLSNIGSDAVSIPFSVVMMDPKNISGLSQSSASNLRSSALINSLHDQSTMHHVLLSFNPKYGLRDVTTKTKVHHSKLIPPNAVNPNNIMPRYRGKFYDRKRIKDSITGLEMSVGPVLFDVDNDSDLDIYLAGSGSRGSIISNPGRLLINESRPGKFVFRDQTVEYRLLDIVGMEYDHQPPRRRAPRKWWNKQD